MVIHNLVDVRKRIAPARPLFMLSARLWAAQKIALGYNADELALIADHRQPADVMFQHQLDRSIDRLVRHD